MHLTREKLPRNLKPAWRFARRASLALINAVHSTMLKAVPHLPAFSVPALRRGFLSAVLLVAAVGWLRGADSRPVVGPGATKEEVITAYGWPNGQSQLGSKEILNYPQGSVTLENGLVERVDFSTKVPWPAPRPRPGTEVPPAKTAAPQPPKNTTESGFDPWTTSLPLAMAQADKQGALILAVFTGSDWSPPSRRFINEVATHPDFVNPLRGDFVFLKLDFPTRVALPAELRTQNEELRARSGVTTYPALVVLSKADETEKVSGAKKTMVGGAILEKVAGGYSVTAGGPASFVGAFHKLEAATSITLKCGGSEIVIDASGITIKSLMVTFAAPKITLTEDVSEVA